MENYLDVLSSCRLFQGIGAGELETMLACLGAQRKKVRKNQLIFQEGDAAELVGLVLSGRVQIALEDYYGDRSIIAGLEAGELFGEAFACAGVEALPVSAAAERDGEILLMDCARILSPCCSACSFHSRLIKNLLRIVAEKNLLLSEKISLLSRRSTREKLIAYLLSQAKKQNSSSFSIPYDRQALADYLGVERSAMSAELGKLRREGLIDFHKSSFTIYEKNFEKTY